MYSYDDRMRAVMLYIRYDFSAADTVRELGYPNRKMLVRWYREYEATGELHRRYKKKAPRHTPEQMQAAVDYYLDHGRNISRTAWYQQGKPIQAEEEAARREGHKGNERIVRASDSQRPGRYVGRTQITGEADTSKTAGAGHTHQGGRDSKKGEGIDPRELTNREKAAMIDALRAKHPLNELLAMMDMPKSSYFYQREAQRWPEKYTALRAWVKRVFAESRSCYGYRRIHAAIRSAGIVISEKVIRRIMQEEQLVVPYSKKKRRYSSYNGEITPAVDNLVARDFHAARPNEKWLTDLTEFHIPAGKVYLSPMIDCFDGMAVSWAIGTGPDAELVSAMLDDAIGSLQHGERPIVHTDRGCHYRWPGLISRMEEAGLTRSMSKEGCTLDNAAREGFFGRIKDEMFYCRSWAGVTIDRFIDELDSYLRRYNEERIKMSLGAKSPKAHRQSIGLTA